MTSSTLSPHRMTLLLVLGVCLWACSEDTTTGDGPNQQNPIMGASGMTAPIAAGQGGAGATVVPTAGIGSAGSAGSVGSAAGTGAAGAAGGSGASSAGQGGSIAGTGASGSSGSGSGTGGSSGSGGAAGTSGAGGAGGSEPDAGDPDPEPDASIGVGGTVRQTIVVRSGETFDGDNKRYVADPNTLGDGSQDEGQMPVFRLEDGARLINVVLGAPAADGIHTYGDVTLENVVWEDIGEDAMTIKESGTVVLDGGSAANGEDKIFQINAASTFRVSNFTARNAGKFIRQNGGTTFKVDVFIDECDIADMDEAIFRTDSSVSTVSMTNTRYHNIGEELFMGVTPANITQRNNQQY